MSASRRCSWTARRSPPERLSKLDRTRVTKRVEMDGVRADALAEVFDDLPDTLTGHAAGLLLTAIPPVLGQEERLTRRRARPFLR
jgi:hypothetical protein